MVGYTRFLNRKREDNGKLSINLDFLILFNSSQKSKSSLSLKLD